MSTLRNIKKNESGVAALEFAILLPFLLLLLYGVFTVATNVMLSRKFDAAVSDLAFLISREGRIAWNNVDANDNCPTEGCTGGKENLTAITNGIMPILLYPIDTKGAKEDYAMAYDMQIMFLGLPVIATADPSISKDVIRMMWRMEVASPNNINVSSNSIVCHPLAGSTVVSGKTYPTSTFRTKHGFTGWSTSGSIVNLATAVFPGQSFIVVNGKLDKNNVTGTAQPSGGVIHTPLKYFRTMGFEKYATYAVRSRWKDKPEPGYANGDGRVDSNEFVNDMHFCTDCQSRTGTGWVYTSQHTYFSEDLSQTDSNTCASMPDGTDNGFNTFNVYKSKCVPTQLAANAPNYWSSGCAFQ